MRSLQGIGSVFRTTMFRLHLAESCFEFAELDQARSHLDAAFAHFQTHGETFLAPELYRIRLMLLRAEAAPSEALDHTIRIGLEIARSPSARTPSGGLCCRAVG